MSKFREVVIASVARTPIGSFGGALSPLSAPQLGALAIKGAIEKAGIDPKLVEECYMGNVIGANQGQAPARQSALLAGLEPSTCCTTINKVCSSGMKSVMIAAQTIMLGQRDVIIAGGFESMSNVPYYLEKARTGYRYNHGQIIDGIVKDGLWDAKDNHHMGSAGEDCARKFNFSRQDQDDFAIESYKRAAEAAKNGRFGDEIVPVTVPGARRGESTVVSEDEDWKKIDFKKVPTLKPAFETDGTITAANASNINDGGCALLILSLERAKQLNIKPLAYIRGFGDAERAPIEFPIAPAYAAPRALEMAGISQEQIDFWEFNEAFSVVVLANAKLLGLDLSKVNVDGGAVSLGHPIGMSGARVVAHLANVLHQRGGKFGCAAICNGGGGGSAMILEKYE